MKRFATTSRIAFALAMWSATVLLCLRMGGVIDDGLERDLQSRTRLAESIAVHCSQAASRGDRNEIAVALESVVRRNADLLSAKCDFENGDEAVVVGDPSEQELPDSGASSIDAISVPVLRGEKRFADVQLRFRSALPAAWWGFVALPSVQVSALAFIGNLLGFLYLLRRCFLHLDPSRTVPDHVRNALDTLAEGVAVLNSDKRINLANTTFGKLVDASTNDLAGKHLDQLPWQIDGNRKFSDVIEILADGDASRAACPVDLDKVHLEIGDQTRTLKPNAVRIMDNSEQCRGYLVSLDDITSLEEKTRQLKFLATRDPLTGCFNRRSFFEMVQEAWGESRELSQPLSVLMVDIDHFKSVNDTYGHAMGDEVLKGVASVLLDTAHDTDLVCRFGGEEFCVLLPRVDLQGAKIAGERYRQAIAALAFDKLSVTASLGCSDLTLGADSFEALQDQADQCLYHAKRNGRDQTVGFDQVMANHDQTVPAVDGADSEGGIETELAPEKALLRSLQTLMSEARDGGRSDIPVDALTEAISRV
ncbi:MAG: diguanylate cyclase [Planctomycetota bacterium]